ncbi:hypothetical protein D3C87_491710 [compost metagenome]
MAEFFGIFGQLLFSGIGQEGADFSAARRHGADGEADQGAAQPGFPGTRPVLRTHPDRTLDGFDLVVASLALRDNEQRFADGEHGDRKRRHFHTVEQVGNAEAHARLAGQLVDADDGERKADEQRGEAAQRRIPEGGGNGDEGEHHQREIFTRAEDQRQLDDVWRDKRERDGGDEAGDEGADGGGGQGRAASALAGHLVAFERGDDRGAFARRVEQDRGGRSAIHAAIIDAGEHDERTSGIEPVGDGQK